MNRRLSAAGVCAGILAMMVAPVGLAVTPDGKHALVSASPGGGPSRPRGIVVTPDGRYAAITGAARGTPNSGVLWVMDVPARKVVSRVTGVGNETYLLALLPRP